MNLTWDQYEFWMLALIVSAIVVGVATALVQSHFARLKTKLDSMKRALNESSYPFSNQVTFVIYCVLLWFWRELFTEGAYFAFGLLASLAIVTLSVGALWQLARPRSSPRGNPLIPLQPLLCSRFYRLQLFTVAD